MAEDSYPSQEDLDRLRHHIEAIEKPLGEDEALALLDFVPVDDDTMHGLAWTVLHLIETAGPAVSAVLAARAREAGLRGWQLFLLERARRGGWAPPP